MGDGVVEANGVGVGSEVEGGVDVGSGVGEGMVCPTFNVITELVAPS